MTIILASAACFELHPSNLIHNITGKGSIQSSLNISRPNIKRHKNHDRGCRKYQIRNLPSMAAFTLVAKPSLLGFLSECTRTADMPAIINPEQGVDY
jgi:hypothetical protein